MEHDEHAGEIKKITKGAIIQCVSTGNTTTYSLKKIEDKGTMFVGPNTATYEGMVIGEHNLEADIEMNAVKSKAMTNIRVTGAKEIEVRL